MPTIAAKQYHLSPDQIEFFDQNGYLILRNWIKGEMLERLQAAGSEWIALGENLKEGDDRSDFAFAKRPTGEVFFRVDYLHDKGQVASLELLGSPEALGVAESLSGPNFVPTYESMVFKQSGEGEVIRWHQDAVHPRNHRIYNFDLYLDRSEKGAGALQVIPGSQKGRLDGCAFEEKYGWDHPDMIWVEMEPGDVLLHDVMVIHGSARTHGKALRRTIYYEFRSAEQILSEGPWDREWIDRRLRMVPLALEAHRTQYPDKPQFDWQIDPEYRPKPTGDRETELKIAHIHHTAGSYCSAGSVI
jgi:ectoine hydroxylase-related dioxygenase (phytanoyl-CoA dioxygenase family)